MAMQRSRDRNSHRLFQSQPPPPPPPPQPMVATAYGNIPFAALQYQQQQQHQQHHHQQQQQQQQQHQLQQQQQQQRQHHHHHQVQMYQRADALLHGQANPSMLPADLAMARQRAVGQPQQQASILLPPPQRMQPPSGAGWDDRGAFRHGPTPPIPPQRLDSSGDVVNSIHVSRLDHSSGTSQLLLENHSNSSSRLVTGYRPYEKQQQQQELPGVGNRGSSHDRSVYWQPLNSMYPDVMLHRSYQQRTPSPSPQRIRNCEHYVESGDRGHFRVVATPPSRSREVVRKRSRDRSPPVRRFQRVPRMSGRQVQRTRHNPHNVYSSTDSSRKDDDDREDGQLTPARSPEIHEEARRRTARSTNDSHRKSNNYRKRDRSGFNKEQGSPVKKSRFDDRVPHTDVTGEGCSKKLTATGHKQVYQKDAAAARPDANVARKDPVASTQAGKDQAGGEEAAKVAGTSGIIAVSDAKEKRKHSSPWMIVEELSGGPETKSSDSLQAAATEIQEVVNMEISQEEPGEAAVNEVLSHKVGKVAVNADSTEAGDGTTVTETAIEPLVIGLVTMDTGKPSEARVAAEKPSEAFAQEIFPPQVVATTELDPAQKAVAPENQRQVKQAVLTIRKNPTMPVAFKPRQTAQTAAISAGVVTTSKTWHRTGNAASVSKLSNVFTAGNASAQAPNGAAYVRKGNSLVRTSGSTTPVKQTKSSPLRAAVVKKTCLKPTEATPMCTGGTVTVSEAAPGGNDLQALPDLNISLEVVEGTSNKPEVYIKRKTNQLVRNNAVSEKQDSPEVPPVMRTRLGKALRLKKQSLVWTLSGSKKAPALLPWKKRLPGRARTRKLKALPKGKKGSLLSLISKKLQALRTSQPLYTRSANGFSLHRSGVCSVAGANLKWTKSLEKRSREANEEATKAVAAVEKHCRKDTDISTQSAGKVGQSRERIVLVGLVRYKMDPSKRTLQRLHDSPENTSVLSSSTGDFSASALLTPKRASIGGALYVRMGNGNQLVRDPKASSRALASEKVRWSLHKVRSRISKKQNYCQFFTRFGKCNKGDGKCPYIHDADKVVVCTKFLKGTCTNTECLLTHKVIPERMPDCSFFLQGLCINEECPYRHVNVNPNAPVCEGFLKGYCASGDQCNKKHTNVCPVYESTGECPDRKTCKLHHPKKKDKIAAAQCGVSSKKNEKRRYFVGLELPPRPVAVGSSSRVETAMASLSALTEFISLQDMATADDTGGDCAINRDEQQQQGKIIFRQPRRGLLYFNDMSEEEVDRLIKPAFVWQSQQESQA